jgi:hypothetical protein
MPGKQLKTTHTGAGKSDSIIRLNGLAKPFSFPVSPFNDAQSAGLRSGKMPLHP